MSTASLALRLVLPLALVACAPRPRTQVTVVVHAEAPIARDARSLRVAVLGGGAGVLEPRLEQTVTNAGAPIDFPVEIAVVPLGDDASRRFSAEALALDGTGGRLGTVRVLSSFVASRYVRFDLLLEDCCRGVTCASTQTCRACVCDDANVDLGSMVLDGGVPDSAPPDSALTDAPTPSDAGVLGPDVLELPLAFAVNFSPNRHPALWAPPMGPACPSSGLAATADHGYGSWYLHNGGASTERLQLTTERWDAGLTVDPVLIVYDVAAPGTAPDPLPTDPLACRTYVDDDAALGIDSRLVVTLAPGATVLCILTTAFPGPLEVGVQVELLPI